MSFHIKCFFGKHDWELINTVCERKILESLDGKLAEDRLHGLNYRIRRYPISYRGGVLYEQKICLRCCAIKDEVAIYLRDFNGEKIHIEFKKFQAERRQKEADSMSKSCAADKFVRI
jgi:hypothetical protein